MPRTSGVRALAAIAIGAAIGLSAGGGLLWERAQAGVDSAPLGAAATALWSGSILIQNHGGDPATVVVNFYSTTGVLVKSFPLPGPIPSKGSFSVDTEAIGDLPNGFAGSAVVSANQPVSATFQGFDVTNPNVNRTLYNGFSDGSSSIFVPAISNAYADQTSMLAVQNVDPTPASVSIRFFERFTGQLSSTVTDTIPANSSHFYDAGKLPGSQQLPPPWSGAALVQSTGGRVVAAVHQPYLSSNKAVAFEGVATVGQTVYLPTAMYLYAPQQQTTFIAVQNTQATPINYDLTFMNKDGASVGTISGSIPGFQKVSWNPGSAGLPAGFLGSAVVQATGPIAAIVNIGSVTDISMAFTGPTSGSMKQALPYIRWAPSSDPKGWRTYIGVMNIDPKFPVDLTIKYYDQNGTLVQAPSFRGVPPNTKANDNPGLFIGEGNFVGTVEIEASRAVVAIVNAITSDGSLAESYTSMPIPIP